jgi:hypothetical protein
MRRVWIAAFPDGQTGGRPGATREHAPAQLRAGVPAQIGVTQAAYVEERRVEAPPRLRRHFRAS